MNGTCPYVVLGRTAGPMLARKGKLSNIRLQLAKPTPDHISVIGPRYCGKTTFLRHVYEEYRGGVGAYVTSIQLDLRHDTPQSDDLFLEKLRDALGEALQALQPKLSSLLRDARHGELRDALELVAGELPNENARVLVVLDGFDYISAAPEITRHLWDFLLHLARKDGLQLLTGSRLSLREICHHTSRTSDLWGIFHPTPVVLGPLVTEEWDDWLAPFGEEDVTLDGAARKELENWTGGILLLAAALSRVLFESARPGHCLRKGDIDKAAEVVLRDYGEVLAALWDDCGADERSHLVEIATKQEVAPGEISPLLLRALERRGLIRQGRGGVRHGSRLMQRYVSLHAGDSAWPRRLFGDAARYERNIRDVLELRLSGIQGLDGDLRRYVANAILHLRPNPRDSLVWMRTITHRALELIWERELPEGKIPDYWVKLWADAKWDGGDRIPAALGRQCRLLQLMTGAHRVVRLARFTTKSTYLLLDHVKQAGDYGQHYDNGPVPVDLASAAVGLCESLARDFCDSQSVVPGAGQ